MSRETIRTHLSLPRELVESIDEIAATAPAILTDNVKDFPPGEVEVRSLRAR